MLDDSRHDRERSVRVSYGRDVGRRGAAERYRQHLRPHHGRKPELFAGPFRQVPPGWRQWLRSARGGRLRGLRKDPPARARHRGSELPRHPRRALTDYFSWNIYDSNGPAVPTTTYSTTALTNLAIDYIHNAETARPEEPWFIYQAYNAPHAATAAIARTRCPRASSTPWISARSATRRPEPAHQRAGVQGRYSGLGYRTRPVAERGRPGKDDRDFPWRQRNAAEVKDKGSKIRGSKGSAYEARVRVPFFVTGAGVTRRGRANDLVVTTDLYATILSLTGINVSHVNNSYSIKPLLSDAAATSGRTHPSRRRRAARATAVTRSRIRVTRSSPTSALGSCTIWSPTRWRRPTCTRSLRTRPCAPASRRKSTS